MADGYTLQVLHIDVTDHRFQVIPLKPDLVETYIGGRGLGAKFYHDLIGPETDPLGPENLFMVLTGPLTATMAPGAGTHLIVTKSPSAAEFQKWAGKIDSRINRACRDMAVAEVEKRHQQALPK